MIVVSDTTPLITLIKAEKLDILHDLFGEVVIPEADFLKLRVTSLSKRKQISSETVSISRL